MPGYLVRVAIEREYIQFGVEPDRRNRLCLQSFNQLGGFGTHLLMHRFYEIYRQQNDV